MTMPSFKNRIFIFLILLIHIALSLCYEQIYCDPTAKSRSGRARILSTIPCDLTQQSYCNLPGSSYPWTAVKRFVYENQGMVKRMYGDLRHIFVVKSELDNEINFEDVKNTADKYSQTFNSRRQMKAKKITVENKNQRSNDVMDKLEQPHFRPAGSKLSTTSSKLRLPTSKQPMVIRNESFTIFDNFIKDILDTTALKLKDKTDSSSSNIFVIQKSTKLSPTSTTTASISKTSQVESSTENTTKFDDNLENREIQELRETEAKVEEIISNLTVSIFSNDLPASTSKPTLAKKPDESSKSKLNVESQVDNDQTISESDQPQTISDRIDLNSFTKDTDVTDNTKEAKDPQISQSDVNSLNLEEVEANDGNKNDKDGKDKNKKPSMTLFQDAVQKEPPVQHNLRGVNACPVKEEVVAPFWGNNTRGEVLALLNVYPFEQYINWEKCSNEHEQMYCRDGCKCEQQYRLHRLLAYDPMNECRGIFSDWFRFPSCCICKCYDIPFDYRVTSRSPRQKEDLQPPSHRQGRQSRHFESEDIYEETVDSSLYEHFTPNTNDPE